MQKNYTILTDEGINWAIIIAPALIGMIISVVLNGMGKMSKTADSTITGAIKLDEIAKQLGAVEALVSKISEKLEQIAAEVKLHSYRLDKLNHNHQ